MRKLLLSLMLAMALAIGSTATGSAATAVPSPPAGTYIDTVMGIETAVPTNNVSPFAGYASGALPGFWKASVGHTQVVAGPITGGSFALYSLSGVVSGTFTSGSISGGGNCTQTFHVAGGLSLTTPSGTGIFDATLKHYGYVGPGGCHIFFATIHGLVTLNLTS